MTTHVFCVEEMSKKPIVSIIVPVFNKQESIGLTLNSLARQTIKEYLEIIFINDASTDASLSILEKFKSDHPEMNITVFTQPQNQGLLAGRRMGVILAKGLFVAMLDADDWVDDDYYEEMLFNEFHTDDVRPMEFLEYKRKGALLKAVEKYYSMCPDILYNTGVIKYYSDTQQYDAKDTILKVHDYGYYELDPTNKVIRDLFTKNWNIVWNKFVKRSVAKTISAIPPYRVNIFEDILISYVWGMNAETIKVVNSNAKIFYNLTDQVDHQSKHILRRDKRDTTQQSTATVFLTLSSLCLEYNKLDWYRVLKKYRGVYIKLFSRKYLNSFKERFGDDDFSVISRNAFRGSSDMSSFTGHGSGNDDDEFIENFIGENNLGSNLPPTKQMIAYEKSHLEDMVSLLSGVTL